MDAVNACIGFTQGGAFAFACDPVFVARFAFGKERLVEHLHEFRKAGSRFGRKGERDVAWNGNVTCEIDFGIDDPVPFFFGFGDLLLRFDRTCLGGVNETNREVCGFDRFDAFFHGTLVERILGDFGDACGIDQRRFARGKR